MEDIREWISDNLRYILLGLALVLVFAVAVVGIRAISNIATGSSSSKAAPETEAKQEAATTDVIVDSEGAADQQTSTLTQNDAKVLTTMTSYYNARTNGDTETLRKLYPSMDGQDEASLTSSYMESYSNVTTYSRPGLTDGSYIAYVCYDAKVRDIDTMVPSLIEFYLMSDESGNLYIADTEGDSSVEAYCEEARQSKEVQDLIASVQKSLEDAENSDPALKDFMSNYGTPAEEGSTEDTEGESTEVVAIDSCNVRSEPNTDSDDNIIGSLYVGDTATRLGEEDGWTKIDYNGETAYVSSDFVTTPEEAQAAEEASYFEPAAAGEGEDSGSSDEYNEGY